MMIGIKRISGILEDKGIDNAADKVVAAVLNDDNCRRALRIYVNTEYLNCLDKLKVQKKIYWIVFYAMKENVGKSIVMVEFDPLMMEYALKLPIQCKYISILSEKDRMCSKDVDMNTTVMEQVKAIKYLYKYIHKGT